MSTSASLARYTEHIAYVCSHQPSASAYITYYKADDALWAIQAVINISVDEGLSKPDWEQQNTNLIS
jgi:hypothetical protein